MTTAAAAAAAASSAPARAGVDGDERGARAVLLRAQEPGDPVLAAAVLQHGACEVLARWRAGAEVVVRDAAGRPVSVDPAGSVRRRLDGAIGSAELEAGARAGARLVCPGDDEWPAGLDDLQHVDRVERAGPPLGLWVRGEASLAERCAGSVACVGARAATAYGCEVAGELAADLAERGRTVVSGAAYGIDAAAHRGALAVSGRTLAVLASGVDVVYPRGHVALVDRLLDAGGLVVSECPPGAVPYRSRFLARNRLIAAMTAGTVVVEAASRSGALSTARWARDLNRAVLGVPGPVTSALSAGVHSLLREYGTLVATADHVLEAIGDLSTVGCEPPGASRPWDALDPDAAAVLEAVPGPGAVDVDTLLARTGLRLGPCLQALERLAGDGLVDAVGPHWRLGPATRGSVGA